MRKETGPFDPRAQRLAEAKARLAETKAKLLRKLEAAKQRATAVGCESEAERRRQRHDAFNQQVAISSYELGKKLGRLL